MAVPTKAQQLSDATVFVADEFAAQRNAVAAGVAVAMPAAVAVAAVLAAAVAWQALTVTADWTLAAAVSVREAEMEAESAG